MSVQRQRFGAHIRLFMITAFADHLNIFDVGFKRHQAQCCIRFVGLRIEVTGHDDCSMQMKH